MSCHCSILHNTEASIHSNIEQCSLKPVTNCGSMLQNHMRNMNSKHCMIFTTTKLLEIIFIGNIVESLLTGHESKTFIMYNWLGESELKNTPWQKFDILQCETCTRTLIYCHRYVFYLQNQFWKMESKYIYNKKYFKKVYILFTIFTMLLDNFNGLILQTPRGIFMTQFFLQIAVINLKQIYDCKVH